MDNQATSEEGFISIKHPSDIAIVIQRLDCCAFQEIQGIHEQNGNPTSFTNEEIMAKVLYRRYNGSVTRGAIYIFSAVYEFADRAYNLATFITNNNFGVVVPIAPIKNPNSNHIVVSYLWRIENKLHMDEMQKWYNRLRFKQSQIEQWHEARRRASVRGF